MEYFTKKELATVEPFFTKLKTHYLVTVKGVSRKEIADELGVDPSIISKWVKDARRKRVELPPELTA